MARFENILFVLFSASRKYCIFFFFFFCSGQEERLWIPLISSYEDTKFGVEGEADFKGEAVSGSPQMRPQEENQDSGDVEDILEFNGEP